MLVAQTIRPVQENRICYQLPGHVKDRIDHRTILKRVWLMTHLNSPSPALPRSFIESKFLIGDGEGCPTLSYPVRPVSHRLMASAISVRGEPESVNLIIRAFQPDILLLDIYLHL